MSNNSKHYYTIDESLSDAGAKLIDRDLQAEYRAGEITLVERLHLTQEQRLTRLRREAEVVRARYEPVHFERIPDEGLL